MYAAIILEYALTRSLTRQPCMNDAVFDLDVKIRFYGELTFIETEDRSLLRPVNPSIVMSSG